MNDEKRIHDPARYNFLFILQHSEIDIETARHSRHFDNKKKGSTKKTNTKKCLIFMFMTVVETRNVEMKHERIKIKELKFKSILKGLPTPSRVSISLFFV